MTRQITEADWKVFRKLRSLALERFCDRVLSELEPLCCEDSGSAHDRYLEVFRLIEARDEELARSFNNPRRSTALIQLAYIRADHLLTDEEFAQFGDDTRSVVEWLVQSWAD
jgi:hypothetical protein